jgi:hypothetical protein
MRAKDHITRERARQLRRDQTDAEKDSGRTFEIDSSAVLSFAASIRSVLSLLIFAVRSES